MMPLLGHLAGALFQAQVPVPADQKINTTLVLTQAVAAIARKIDGIMKPSVLDQGPGYITMLFLLFYLVMVISLLWEGGNILLEAGVGEGHRGGMRRLMDAHFLQKLIKAAILGSLALGAYVYLYKPSGTVTIMGMDSTAQQDAAEVVTPFITLANPIDLIVAPVGTPPAVDSSIAGTIAKVSDKLGAWAFARQAQDATAAKQAENAAEKVWADLNPDGTSPATPVNQDSNSEDGLFASISNKVLGFFRMIGNSILTYGTSIVLLGLNIGLDVMIVRALMFNAIYMLLAYKIAIFLLPLALIAAYWDQWRQVLIGIVQVVVATTIGLHVLADMTAVIADPTQVAQLVSQATAQATPADKQAAMELYAKKIYADMTAGGNGGGISLADFKARVVNDMGKPVNTYIFNTEATFWAPVRVFLLLTMLITLVGKIGTVISDTLSGTMSYHQ